MAHYSRSALRLLLQNQNQIGRFVFSVCAAVDRAVWLVLSFLAHPPPVPMIGPIQQPFRMKNVLAT